MVLIRSLSLFISTSGLGRTLVTGGWGTVRVPSFLGSVTVAGGGIVLFSVFVKALSVTLGLTTGFFGLAIFAAGFSCFGVGFSCFAVGLSCIPGSLSRFSS